MKKTVLVIDDHKPYADVITLLLGYRGFSALAMYDARAVLTHLAQQRPDLIVCDMHMPDLDGLTLARRIRESGYLCPIVLMSAGAMPAIDLPAVRVAQKSIEMDELLELLTEELA